MDLLGFINFDINKFFDASSKVEFQDAYEQWGKYGWTLIGNAPVLFFRDKPSSQKNADIKAMVYFDKRGLSALVQELKKYGDNDKVLSEALFCFKNKTYRGCAMIMVSLFERDMLKIQKLSEKKGRSVGKKAIQRTKFKISMSSQINKYNTTQLYACNMIAYLETLFSSSATNFLAKAIPENINKNYLMHGMHTKKIRRRDCIKLLNAYSHWLFLINNYDIKNIPF